jgi:hypothetical protein
VEEYGRTRQATGGNIIQRMRFAWRITKATNTHSEYVILIAFPRQQWLCERASMVRYKYIPVLFYLTVVYCFSCFWSHADPKFMRICISCCRFQYAKHIRLFRLGLCVRRSVAIPFLHVYPYPLVPEGLSLA